MAAGDDALRRALERAEVRRRDVPDARVLRPDAGLAALREAGFAVLRDAGLAARRDAGLAALRDAGFEGAERVVVLRLFEVDRLRGEELLLDAELRVAELREPAGFDAALAPDAALERVPPADFRVLLVRDFDAARFEVLPLRP